MSIMIKAPVAATQLAFDAGHKIKEKTGVSDKVAKIVRSNFELLRAGFNVTNAPIRALSSQLKQFCGIISGFHFIDRAWEWITPGKNGVYRWQVWKKDADGERLSEWSEVKTTSSVFLTAAHGFSFVEFVSGIGLMVFGPVAAIATLAKNILYVPASFFGSIDCGQKIDSAEKKVVKLQTKQLKWHVRLTQWNVSQISQYYAAKQARLSPAMTAIEAARRNHIHNGAICQNDANALSEVHQAFGRKVNQYNQAINVAKENARRSKNKNWFGLANNVGKFAIGIFSLGALGFGIMTLPYVVVATSAGWIATHAFGVGKELYGSYRPEQRLPATSFRVVA